MATRPVLKKKPAERKAVAKKKLVAKKVALKNTAPARHRRAVGRPAGKCAALHRTLISASDRIGKQRPKGRRFLLPAVFLLNRVGIG